MFLWDHLHLRKVLRLDVLDPWVMLGAFAQATERIRLGALVTPLARRRPWKVAKEVVTLDHLSGGRAVVGVGLGTPPDDEFGDFGDPTDAREPAVLLDDGLTVLAGLLTGEPFVHDGPRFHVDAHFLPAPVQRPRPPIWVAGVLPESPAVRTGPPLGGRHAAVARGLMTPKQVSEVLAITGQHEGFDVVVTPHDDHTPAEYADAGATWLISSPPPWLDGWRTMLDGLAAAGPVTA